MISRKISRSRMRYRAHVAPRTLNLLLSCAKSMDGHRAIIFSVSNAIMETFTLNSQLIFDIFELKLNKSSVSVDNLEEPFRMSFYHSEEELSKAFNHFVSDYDPSIDGEMERQIVVTNEFKSSTLICVDFAEVETKTEFYLYIRVS